MAKFISREKLSKKARKELDSQKRTVWAFSPTPKKVESKKLYNRKKNAHVWKGDFGMSAFACPELFRNKDLREKICKWRSPKRCCWQRLC